MLILMPSSAQVPLCRTTGRPSTISNSSDEAMYPKICQALEISPIPHFLWNPIRRLRQAERGLKYNLSRTLENVLSMPYSRLFNMQLDSRSFKLTYDNLTGLLLSAKKNCSRRQTSFQYFVPLTLLL